LGGGVDHEENFALKGSEAAAVSMGQSLMLRELLLLYFAYLKIN
jgi:hypothetical protein